MFCLTGLSITGSPVFANNLRWRKKKLRKILKKVEKKFGG